MDAPISADVLLFEHFRLDRRGGGLFRCNDNGAAEPVKLGSRALDLLCLLAVRSGDLVTKGEIMAAVWPNMAVEEANLTMQISALRRVLDQGRSGESCIRTVAGRGYRFVLPVTPPEEPCTSQALALSAQPARRRNWRRLLLPACGTALAMLLAIGIWRIAWPGVHAAAPRMSLVVLPFESRGGNPADDTLAEAVTDDLTTDLSNALLPGAFVVGRGSAYAYKDKAQDRRTIGQELGVRYVVEGSLRRTGQTVTVDIRLVFAETGEQLWSERFDAAVGASSAGQEAIVERIEDELSSAMVGLESARSLRERAADPDAFDFILRGWAIQNQPPSLQRDQQALSLYERALALDPDSVAALSQVAYFLVDRGTAQDLHRAGSLLGRARSMAPDSMKVLNNYLYWLVTVGRCNEAIPLAEQAIARNPARVRRMTGIYNGLAICKTWTGHAEDDIALQQTADRLNPLSPWKFTRYRHMAWASFLLGRDQDAIRYMQQGFAIKPDVDNGTQFYLRVLAAAYARTGDLDQARRYLAQADRISPYDTVRGHFPDDPSSPVYVEQIRQFQDALRLAGERDHADEDADFGVPPDNVLHGEAVGKTPMLAQGATTIRTADLARLLADAKPLVIDVASHFWGQSISGAVGLKLAGAGGSRTDAVQGRLRVKLHELTGGDLARPIVALGWNAEEFYGRNLALRLVALGYTQVYWYRGGREAWEVHGLPETPLDVQEW